MRSRRIVLQALPVILVSLVLEIGAGALFGKMDGILRGTPGLLVLFPSLLLLRGNVNASLGSRLSSAVHLGLISGDVSQRDAEVRVNVTASYLLGIIMGIIAGLAAHAVMLILGAPSAGPLVLGALGGTVGIVSGIPMVPVTLYAVRAAFRRGIDPDNVIGPALLTLGDLVTVVTLFVVAGGWYALGGGLG